ncbi:hypothetical protein [Sorangium sp. So ce1024]|uniref:hypothetical protein n=1 Tax=unclassified Sorangium TaxID=2621164 RepID=UPI003EFF1681
MRADAGAFTSPMISVSARGSVMVSLAESTLALRGGSYMRRIHIALGVRSLADSIADDTHRLAAEPHVIVPDQYALWRTDTVSFSIRQIPAGDAPGLRHLGWEDDAASAFSDTRDCNGIVWEEFGPEHQLQEILGLWPDAQIER